MVQTSFYYEVQLLLSNEAGPPRLFGCVGIRNTRTFRGSCSFKKMREESPRQPVVCADDSYLELSAHGVTLRVTEDTSEVLLTKVLGCLPMLNDATCFKQVYIVCGYADLRSGIDTLASIISEKTDNTPFVPDTLTLYLFCGNKSDRIKGLVWEKDGFLLLYKRLEQGNFVWPRNAAEVQAITKQQLCWLMEGLTIAPKKTVQEVKPPEHMS